MLVVLIGDSSLVDNRIIGGSGGLPGAVVNDHAALPLVPVANDEPLTTVMHGVLIATLERIGDVLFDELGEDGVALTRPAVGVALDGTHPVAISRVSHADLANGIRAGRCWAGRAGRCRHHGLVGAPFAVARDAAFMSRVCPIPRVSHIAFGCLAMAGPAPKS